MMFRVQHSQLLICAADVASLVVSNIPSCASGLDLWGTATSVGVQAKPGSPALSSLVEHQQKLGDGVLEFLCINSAVAWGLERVKSPCGFDQRAYRNNSDAVCVHVL